MPDPGWWEALWPYPAKVLRDVGVSASRSSGRQKHCWFKRSEIGRAVSVPQLSDEMSIPISQQRERFVRLSAASWIRECPTNRGRVLRRALRIA